MTIALVLSIMAIGPAQAMSVETMVELKKAGLSDATIQMAAREKVIETVAFTAEELIQLKQAGFEERTIQILIQERSFMRGPQKVVYGRDTRPLRLSSVNDIIALKDAGMSDDVIQAIVKVAGSRKDEDYYRSWEMLENMNLEVDVGR
ncbi:MAG: hypothetical protein PVF55_06090 [Desulfobacterales bacterium]|jgi:hypothetical protein